jgi:hypothetical protein
MAEYEDREHYIPMRKSDMEAMLCRDEKLTPADAEQLRKFCALVNSVWHAEYHATLDQLEDAYAPFDPDADTKTLDSPTAEERARREAEVFEKLSLLMEKANFQPKTEEDVKKALEGTSEGGINMDVDLGVFQEGRWRIFARGDAVEEKTVRRWYKLWMKETVKDEIWKRLVMVFKLQKHKRLDKKIDFDKVYVRVYKDIPKMDLETLIPGATPQMSRLDKFNIFSPLLSGGALVLYKILFFLAVAILGLSFLGKFDTKGMPGAVDNEERDKLEKKLEEAHKGGLPPAEAIDKLAAEEKAIVYKTFVSDFNDLPPGTKAWYYFTSGAFLLLVMGLGSYAFKSYAGYQNTKTKYEKNLSQALYFQSLDSNAGVLFRLLNEAETQEWRETVLAYFYLWKYAPPEGWTEEQLDDYIEEQIEAKTGLKVDFEVDDAVGKLERLGIVTKTDDLYAAIPIEQAVARLKQCWAGYAEGAKVN